MDHASDERRRFDELVLPQLDAAYNLARWLSGSASEADDVVQEAFLRAYRLFGSFHGDQPRPWLLAIVRNTWFTTCQQRKSAGEVCSYDDLHENQPLPAWHDGQDSPEQWLLRQEDVRLVHRALERLPLPFREVLVLRELEELPYRDIARVADIAIGTVMSRLARGRRMLAAAVMALQHEGTAAGPAHAPTHAPTQARAPSDALAPAPHPAGETGHGLQ
jgi:RNA polymerase sigma-70 factor (ECF subfamily)